MITETRTGPPLSFPLPSHPGPVHRLPFLSSCEHPMSVGFHDGTTLRLISQWNKAATIWSHHLLTELFCYYIEIVLFHPTCATNYIWYMVTIMQANYCCVASQDHKMNLYAWNLSQLHRFLHFLGIVGSTDRASSQQLQMWFSEHFSRQNLLRGLSRLLFLLQWNKYGVKKCLKNHIPFDFWDDSTLANQGAGKTIEKPLKELPWNQQVSVQKYTANVLMFCLYRFPVNPLSLLFWFKISTMPRKSSILSPDLNLFFVPSCSVDIVDHLLAVEILQLVLVLYVYIACQMNILCFCTF